MTPSKKKPISRRDFIKTAGAGIVAAGVGPTIFIPRQARAASKELKILQWAHFVPRYDQEFFDDFAKKWGEANGVKVTVDHVHIGQVVSRTSAELAAGSGHDLIGRNVVTRQEAALAIQSGDPIILHPAGGR